MAIAVIILAAGKGTRMHSDAPKVLHKVAHASLLEHAISAAQSLDPERLLVICGHGAEAVTAETLAISPQATCIHQPEQRGTGHAVDQARQALADFTGKVLVLFGDTPFVGPDTLTRLRDSKADVTVLGFHAKEPGRYGRLVQKDGALEAIVEAKDASDDILAIDFCNSGVMAVDGPLLFELLAQVSDDNASGEIYLTDIVALARQAGKTASAIACDEAETLGVNSRTDLAFAEAIFQQRQRSTLLEAGVTLQAPETVHLAFDTVIGRDAVIEPNVVFGRGVTIETGAYIRAFSHLEGCHVSRDAVIGPYARLRPGAELAENTKVGNFVEIKNAVIAEGAKVNHLSYIGDAEIGTDANIGAGTITCNYDGVFKHKTVIGKRAFIGSNSALVAPVSIGDDAMTASGSVITFDVPDAALALARSRQVNKDGMAKRMMDKLRAAKRRVKKDKA